MKLSLLLCGKAFIRTPIKVLTHKEAELINKHVKIPNNVKDIQNEHSCLFNIPRTNFKYEKITQEDMRVGPMISDSKSGTGRFILLEGSRLISEALKTNIKLKTIYFSDFKILRQIPLLKVVGDVRFFKVKEKELKLWSQLDESPGIMAISYLPKKLMPNKDSLPITVIITDKFDEKILGSAIRSIVAANVGRIFYLKDSNNMWHCKTIRSGAGAHFHIPILPITPEDITTRIYNTPNNYVYKMRNEKDICSAGFIHNDVDGLNNDVGGLNNDADGLNNDVDELNNYVDGPNNDVGKLTNEFCIESETENFQRNIGVHNSDNNAYNMTENTFNIPPEARLNINTNDFSGKKFGADKKLRDNQMEESFIGRCSDKNLSDLDLKNSLTDISELKYEGGDVCLIIGDASRLNVDKKVGYIGVKEDLMPAVSLAILILQLNRIVRQYFKGKRN